jgi:hypothetical protein
MSELKTTLTSITGTCKNVDGVIVSVEGTLGKIDPLIKTIQYSVIVATAAYVSFEIVSIYKKLTK